MIIHPTKSAQKPLRLITEFHDEEGHKTNTNNQPHFIIQQQLIRS